VTRPIARWVCAAVLTNACIFGGSSTSSSPTFGFTAATCPGDVAASILGNVSCGFLDVPSRPDDASGAVDQVFVTRIQPETESTSDPVLTFGGDLGVSVDYGTFGRQATELHREVIVMDVRGTGHSHPSLLCPEIDAMPLAPAALPVDSRRTERAFVSAVSSCRDRLVAQGIDLASFDPAAMAEDAEDLRLALGIDRWSLLTMGTSSLVALELLRRYPDHVAAVILDSPQWPGVDPIAGAPASTQRAIAAMASACAEAPPCRAEDPSFSHDVRELERRLGTRPFTTVFQGDRVRLDAGWFILWLRAQLGFVRPPGTFLPGAIHAMARGDQDALRLEARRLFTRGSPVDQELCQMLLPNCWNDVVRNWGVDLTLACLERRSTSEAGRTRVPAMEEAFGGRFLDAACRAWGSGPDDEADGKTVSSDIPVLVVLGRFDPFSSVVAARHAVAGLSRVSVVISPVNGHQVTGVARTSAEQDPGACSVRLRDAWLDNPSASPDTSCLDRRTFDMSLPIDWQTPF